jgi:hypothetical protein
MIPCCEIEQLESTRKRTVTAIGSAGQLRGHGALHLAPNIRQLLDKGERLPASGRKTGMLRG